MKVLVATSSWYPHMSGVTIATERRCHALLAKGHEVVLAVPKFADQSERIRGVQIVSYPAIFSAESSSSWCIPFYTTWIFRRIVRRIHPDVLFLEEPEHILPMDGTFAGIVRGMNPRPRVIGMLHTHYETYLRLALTTRRRLQRLFLKLMYRSTRGVDLLITHCEALRVSSQKYGAERARVGVYHAASPVFFSGAAPAPLSPRKGDILFVGQIRKAKGVMEWAETIGELAKIRPGLRVTFAGKGQDEAEFRQALTVHGAQVDFLGPVSQDQVRELMDSHRVFLNLSQSEAFCTTNLEAMARGMLVVLARGGGHEEQANEGRTALLVDGPDIEATAQTIVKTLASEEKMQAIADAGRAWVQRYQWDHVADEIEAILTQEP